MSGGRWQFADGGRNTEPTLAVPNIGIVSPQAFHEKHQDTNDFSLFSRPARDPHVAFPTISGHFV